MKYLSLVLASTMIIILLSTFGNSFSQDLDSNIASNIFNTKVLFVPKNVKTFVILIPNEAHESPILPKDQRLINQPYVPQNLVIYPGVKIVWFAGDVGHTRKITVDDEKSREIYNSVLKFNSQSEPLSLNQSGNFTYFEYKANKDDPNFVMNGTITVGGPNFNSGLVNGGHALNYNFDTLSVIMIPTMDINKNTKIINENNLTIIDQYSFKDLRETSGGGASQTLLVLGSNDPLDRTIATLKKITSSLPYS